MPLVPPKWYAVRCYLPTNNYGTRIFHYTNNVTRKCLFTPIKGQKWQSKETVL